MQIILSTGNPSKAAQIKAIFAGSMFEVITLTEAGIIGEAVEDGDTLQANALKKSRFAHEQRGGWAMADDTGIFITHLDGAPGVRSARWAGEHATTDEITRHTLAQLEGATDRSATFRTIVALISPSGEERFFEGEVRGRILEVAKVPPQPKMPYSPIFLPDGEDSVWAEMSMEKQNEISHRGQAFRKARAFLERL